MRGDDQHSGRGLGRSDTGGRSGGTVGVVIHEDFDLRIPSDPARARDVQERIIAALERIQFSKRDIFAVRLALDEAITNAIRHGNQGDPQKTVRIQCTIRNDVLRVSIEDEGAGFRPEDVPDPRLEENLERTSGRGLLLMRSYMNHVEYQGRGNILLLEKRRSDHAA